MAEAKVSPLLQLERDAPDGSTSISTFSIMANNLFSVRSSMGSKSSVSVGPQSETQPMTYMPSLMAVAKSGDISTTESDPIITPEVTKNDEESEGEWELPQPPMPYHLELYIIVLAKGGAVSIDGDS